MRLNGVGVAAWWLNGGVGDVWVEGVVRAAAWWLSSVEWAVWG